MPKMFKVLIATFVVIGSIPLLHVISKAIDTHVTEERSWEWDIG
jgi:hypothetical protein